MANTVAIGLQNFETVRQKNCFYVDKTNFIKEWWESNDHTTLITRPRRFGKTLNMSMLECFFSNKYKGRGELFEGLNIWKEEEYRQLQGTYPLIFLSFAELKENNFADALEKINHIIRNIYIHQQYLLNSDVLTDTDRNYYQSILTMNPKQTDVTSSLSQMSDYLHRYHNKRVIILLDEYDTPMQEAWMSGYWEEMSSFMRKLFNSTFKTNPYLERALMTGITRVGKESMFSDLNHINVVSLLSDEYAPYFGFTQNEVEDVLRIYGLEEVIEEVKTWYNGFVIGEHTAIYNPWSIINYLKKKRLKPYWTNTGGNALPGSLVKKGNRELKEMFEQLLEGKYIECALDENISFNRLELRNDAIFSLLFSAGYLTLTKPLQKTDTGNARKSIGLKLTNKEVRDMFEYLISDWFSEVSADYNDFIKAMLLSDVDAMNEYMNRISEDIFSSFDAGKRESGRQEPERFYHGFVLGLMVDLKEEYLITSNRESGFGRYDVVLEPRDRDGKAFILEFKVFNPKREKNLETTVVQALKQIEEKKYAAVLTARGIKSENIYSYGFAFRGKEVLIGDKNSQII